MQNHNYIPLKTHQVNKHLNVFENACVKSSGWVGWDKNAKLFSTDLNGKYVEGKSN